MVVDDERTTDGCGKQGRDVYEEWCGGFMILHRKVCFLYFMLTETMEPFGQEPLELFGQEIVE